MNPKSPPKGVDPKLVDKLAKAMMPKAEVIVKKSLEQFKKKAVK